MNLRPWFQNETIINQYHVKSVNESIIGGLQENHLYEISTGAETIALLNHKRPDSFRRVKLKHHQDLIIAVNSPNFISTYTAVQAALLK